MSEALITRLQEAATNMSLPTMGVATIDVTASDATGSNTMNIAYAQTTIIGTSSQFTTSNGTAKGSSTQIPATADGDLTTTTIYLAVGRHILTIPIYTLRSISFGSDITFNTPVDVEKFTYAPTLRSLRLTRTTGDITALAGRNLRSVYMVVDSTMTGRFGDTLGSNTVRVEVWNVMKLGLDLGGLSAASGLTALFWGNTMGAPVTGSLSNLADKKLMTDLRVQNLAGNDLNLDQLDGCTALLTCYLWNARSVSGDLSALPSGVQIVNVNGAQSQSLTWTAGRRAASATIMALQGVRLSNPDDMFIDQAKCVAKFYSSDTSSRTINIVGPRTSASDPAVATLKGKGYTVIVNGSTL
jgi:hypothetical protein